MSGISSNQRIAKNTIYLYLRMLITMIVQFYTARVVLNTLGVEDYGIYNIVGGVIVLFAFLNNSMSSSTQRFLSYAIGKGQNGNVGETFNTSVYCHAFIALLLIILSETIGLWYFQEKLIIPEGRKIAAMWVYQISVINTVINILRVPHNALIISYEKMSFYAYVSILEIILKLFVVSLLLVSPLDKLISYSLLLLFVSILLSIIYLIYCNMHFPWGRIRRGFNLSEGKTMLSYSGWTMLSSATTVANQQGGNIMLNVFFGIAYNAAYGVANQVSNAVYSFVSNFQMAFQPQIVKQYAAKEYESLSKLITRSSSLSYYLMLLISIPFMMEVDWIMQLWLGNPPEYAGIFCILLLAYFLIDAIQAPLWMIIGANGNLKEYKIWSSCIAMFNLPIAYIILKNGGSVLWVFAIRVVLNFIISCIRVPYIKKFVDFSCVHYLKKVIIPALSTTIVSIVVSYFIKEIVSNHIFVILLILSTTIISIFFIGLNKAEKEFLIMFACNYVNKSKKNL